MKFFKLIRGACLAGALLAGATGANAQLFRAYLKSTGSDANPCTVAAPCRLLPAALGAVSDGGEVWMLDSANYNTSTVNVTKSVTVLAIPGAVGSLVAVGGGAAMSLATPGKKVALRNLSFTRLITSPGTHGVEMTNAAELTVENCNFSNLVNDGVSASGNGRVRVSGSVFSGNNVGVRAYGNAIVNISNTRLHDNGYSGVLADGISPGLATVNVSDSTVTGSQFGVIAWSKLAGANVEIIARRVTVSAALEGVVSYVDAGAGSALVVLASSMVVGNEVNLVQFGATSTLVSFGDNQITEGLTPDQGTVTNSARQ